ncbi:MAG: UpxY family transcription antiterminator, partial [Syntrophobacteraceae bacterium]
MKTNENDLCHTPPDREWYALYVQVNHEKEVVKRLEQKEVVCFLPLMETWSKRRDRRKKIQLPMFPGYVFVHVFLDSYMQLTVVKTPGALSLLHNSQGPLSIPPYQVENIRTVINSVQPLEIHPYLIKGDWVQVVRGPLAGCIG